MNTKRYAISVSSDAESDRQHARVFKYGEDPAFGERLPNRLLAITGEDRELFLNGYRCERHGMGIGAFAYYRRVLESHTGQILEELVHAAHSAQRKL